MPMYKVLLVDDESFVRNGLRNLIDWNSCGFEVVAEADNGEDGLEQILRLNPELVITDIRMPVIDGLELIRRTNEEKAVNPGFIIISGYNDFSYAQQAVRFGVHDFILKPVDEDVMMQTLRRLRDKFDQDCQERDEKERMLHAQMIADVVKDDVDEADLALWMKQLNLTRRDRIIYMFMELNDRFPWENNRPEPKNTVEQVRKIVMESAEIVPRIYLYEHRNRLGWILPAAVPAHRQMDLRCFACELQRRLSRMMNQTTYVYAGKPVNTISDLKESIQTAKDALQYKYTDEKSAVVLYSDSATSPLCYIDMDAELYQRMSDSIEEQNENGIITLTEQIFNQFMVLRFAPEAIKLTIHRHVTSILKIMNRMNVEEDELASLKPIMSWQDVNVSFAALKKLFLDFVLESAELVAKQRKENSKGGIQKIKEYIEAHYKENLSLKSIAGLFFMNPVYLGQLFKKTYGIYFNDFLLQIRVGEAKRLLRQTDMRIYEIADEIGFSNPDYFVTQFERAEKLSPSEYRNKLIQ
ncbi:response regulator [Paenibacillus sp. HB172176]|uniref:response regulator transcription factor n=1 Tax=Paenibacillus sp. HB172176 TaxID=2493690 RepID=UPI00143B5DD8|nr:response regulator [Paenibacillus sp. HB172176]